jgi:pantoate--beta-alanine ligase
MRGWSRKERRAGRTIGFVPTMGSLHAGHLSLAADARARCDRVVASIFVNPAQFGPHEDFARYPRELKRDRRLLGQVGVDVIFAPAERAMYPSESLTRIGVPALQQTLCAPRRPGHFEGVCLIVAKLLHIVEPDELYLGQKDAQQAVILARMVRDLDFAVKVRVLPTVREADGLAMSSRNRYLSKAERAFAPRLHEALQLGRRSVRQGERDPARVIAAIRGTLGGGDVRIEYVEIVDPDTLAPVTRISREVLIALAVHVGPARLIDNVVVRSPGA